MEIQYNNWQSLNLASIDNAFNSGLTEFTNLFYAFDPNYGSITIVNNSRVAGSWNGYSFDLRGSHFTDNVPYYSYTSLSLTNGTTSLTATGNVTEFDTGLSSGYYDKFTYTSSVTSLSNFQIVGKMNVDSFGNLSSGTQTLVSVTSANYTISYSGNITLDANGNVSGGTVNSFKFSDPLGNQLVVNGISLDAVTFDTYSDTQTNTDLSNLFSIINSSTYLNGNDLITGDSQNNTFNGYAGNDSIDGGKGNDKAIYNGTIKDYSFSYSNGVISVKDNNLANGDEGTDKLTSIESLQFNDRSVAVINPNAYLAANTDLLKGYGNNINAAFDHYYKYGVNEGRKVNFDALQYIASYKDLATGFGTNTEAATLHYIEHGFNEGRKVNFNALQYIASYKDLATAFGTNTEAATLHYINNGIKEGRTVSFNALQYIASYKDLATAFGTNTEAATLHYIEHGITEGRKVSFDALAYIASYKDLAAGFGTNTEAATLHYINYGVKEGRTVSFDPSWYIAKYADVYSSFGNDLNSVTKDYIKNGTVNGHSYSVNGDDILNGTAANDKLNGYGGNDTLNGGVGNDTLTGGSGNDTLSGGYGNDTLVGGAGADVFAFDALLNELGNKDTISDFISASDKIQISQNIFNALSLGSLSAADFVMNATGVAQDATDHIVYNSSTGGLYYDADGNGAGTAIQFATLTGHPALLASDFIIV